MVIVFDTNIWISELGLNSQIGSAVRFFIKQKKAKIVVPHVVRLETEAHLRNDLKKYVCEMNNNYMRLLAYFGKLKEIILPDDNDIERKVQEIFSSLGVDIIDFPFTLESAENSLLKTIHKLPPSGENNQQFKDGVIWADCMKLLEEDDVYLISGDKGFYDKRDYKNGLAINLKEEISLFA